MILPAPKRLRELAQVLKLPWESGGSDPLIHSLAYDSRCVTAGGLFVAIRGLEKDGTDFVHDALARGAVAIVAEKPLRLGTTPVLQVSNARKALAELAWHFYDHPEQAMTLTAVTGTNGKTTVASVLRSVLNLAGEPAGLIGTLGVFGGDSFMESPRTTPESLDIAAHLATMRQKGLKHVIIEATSIGIDLERTWRLPFRVAVFTNLTRDHLDYHGTFEAYRECKLRLFREQDEHAAAVINADDPHAERFLNGARGRTCTFGVDVNAHFRASSIQLSRQGTRFRAQTPEGNCDVYSPLLGRFNVYNLLAVMAAAYQHGLSPHCVAEHLPEISAVHGRAETIVSTAPFTVIVDYAHSPDALEKILNALRELNPRRIITVVGAGGDRDKGKRPLMAAAAAKLSDELILTSDNPRREDPEKILDDMMSGLSSDDCYVRIVDRRQAIETALSKARAGDIVLIAGKGHERYQEIAGVKYPFDDSDVARQWLIRAGFTS